MTIAQYNEATPIILSIRKLEKMLSLLDATTSIRLYDAEMDSIVTISIEPNSEDFAHSAACAGVVLIKNLYKDEIARLEEELKNI